MSKADKKGKFKPFAFWWSVLYFSTTVGIPVAALAVRIQGYVSAYFILMSFWAASMVVAMLSIQRGRLKSLKDFEESILEMNLNWARMGIGKLIFFVPCEPKGRIERLKAKIFNYKYLRAYERIVDEKDEGEPRSTSLIRYRLTEKELFDCKLRGYYNTDDIELALAAFNNSIFSDPKKIQLVLE